MGLTKCYFHDQTDAVGLCIECGKALCRQCAVAVGGRLRCESCYIESQLGPESQTLPKASEGRGERRPISEQKGKSRGTLFPVGASGSLVGIVMPIMSFVLLYGRSIGMTTQLWLFASVSLLTALWFYLQSFGFFGLYRNYGEVMALLAFVFGLITAGSYSLFAAVLVVVPNYNFYINFYYVPLVYQVATTAIQGTAFMVVGQSGGGDKLFTATAVVLIAAGCISWLPIGTPALSVSNICVAPCFLRARVPSEPEARPGLPAVDPLKELQ